MAAGYARWRPRVHPHVIERVRRRLDMVGRVRRALDVGCGSGLSTAALEPLAEQCIGLEPCEPMLGYAKFAAPRAMVAVSRAEQLPIESGTIDLITAAGSLNYADLDRFFPEARRVLVRGGRLVVYDFGPGREFTDSGRLSDWYGEFERRYPFPPCRDIDPAALDAAAYGLDSGGSEDFAAALLIDPKFYVEYAMTETSVAAAVRSGIPEGEIRAWCESSIPRVFDNAAREVVFRGYIAYLRAT